MARRIACIAAAFFFLLPGLALAATPEELARAKAEKKAARDAAEAAGKARDEESFKAKDTFLTTTPDLSRLAEIRAILEQTHIAHPIEDPRPATDEPIRQRLVAMQPGSGDAILQLLSDSVSDPTPHNAAVRFSDPTLHDKAIRAFALIWKDVSPAQMLRYFQMQLRCYTDSKPRYPQGLEARVGGGYSTSDGGWVQRAGNAFILKTSTSGWLDGRQVGEPFRYRQAGGGMGGVKTSELGLGPHTFQVKTKYFFDWKGQRCIGSAESKVVRFEMIPRDAPDDLAAPPDEKIDRLIRESLKFGNNIELDENDPTQVRERSRFNSFGGGRDEPGATWKTKDSEEGFCDFPNWVLLQKLPVDLCFEASIHVEGTTETCAANPVVVARGEGRESGSINAEIPDGIARGKSGRVPVRIVLTPSRRLALSRREVTQYYNKPIESEVVYLEIQRFRREKDDPWFEKADRLLADAQADPATPKDLLGRLAAISSPNPWTREGLAAIYANRSRLVSGPVDPSELKRPAPSPEMVRDAPFLVPFLLHLLTDKGHGKWGQVATSAELSLEKIGAPAIPALSDALGDESNEIRQGVIRALGRMLSNGSPSDDFNARAQMIAALSPLMNDPDPIVRSLAVSFLGMSHDEAASWTAAGGIGDADPRVRQAAVSAIENSRNPAFLQTLETVASDPDPGVRSNYVGALAVLKGKAALPEVLGMISDNDRQVRIGAMQAAANLERKKSDGENVSDENRAAIVDALIGMLSDPDDGIRSNAMFYLRQITGLNLKQDSAVWREWAAKRDDPAAVSSLPRDGRHEIFKRLTGKAASQPLATP